MKSLSEKLIQSLSNRIDKYENSISVTDLVKEQTGIDISKSKVPVDLGNGFVFYSKEAAKCQKFQNELSKCVMINVDELA